MRSLGIIGLMAFATAGLAQQPKAGSTPVISTTPAGQQLPPAAVVPPPADQRLDGLLSQWEQKMRAVTSLKATVARTDFDAIDKTNTVLQGEVKFLRPDRASLNLVKTGKPDVFEKYIYTGTFLYEYRPQTKQLRIHELGPTPGQAMDDNFLNFVFGLKAEDAKRRYKLTYVKDDDYYYYLFVEPLTASDRADFNKARLVLWKANFFPRQVEFETTNGGRTKWDILQIDPSARLTAVDFTPDQPAGWSVQRVPRQSPGGPPTGPPAGVNPVPPTKVRPAGG